MFFSSSLFCKVSLAFLSHLMYEVLEQLKTVITMPKYSSFLLLLLLLNDCVMDSEPGTHGNTLSTSVWCTQEKLCTFQNLCYHSETHQFLFILSEQSLLQGLNRSELNQLELSSVHNHNRMFMNLAVVSFVNEILSGATFIDESLFVMNSFKRDNLQHVLHDDLLPLFSTYSLLCDGDIKDCVQKYHLTFANGQELGPYEKWYQAFSKKALLLLPLSDLKNPVKCYKHVRIGLVRSSLWFDYGFTGVQGRLDKPKISGRDLRRFRDYVLGAMNIAPVANRGCAVLVKRTVSRRIVNEDFVKETILKALTIFRPKDTCLVEIDLMKDNSETLLAAVSQSDVLVGMHGAAMVLSVFLKVGATVVEMFPFAIEPYNVSPVMAMTELEDVGLHYVFWRNKDRSLSIPPSTTDTLRGSISHLPTDLQSRILEQERVDAVPCCHDPAYLYYMFQDTVVGPDFERTVLTALRRVTDFYKDDFIFDSFENIKRQWMSPGPVYNVACNLKNDNFVEVSWGEPINSAEFEVLEYDVLAVTGDQPLYSGSVRSTNFVTRASKLGQSLKLWISAKVVGGKLKSKDVFCECFA